MPALRLHTRERAQTKDVALGNPWRDADLFSCRYSAGSSDALDRPKESKESGEGDACGAGLVFCRERREFYLFHRQRRVGKECHELQQHRHFLPLIEMVISAYCNEIEWSVAEFCRCVL